MLKRATATQRRSGARGHVRATSGSAWRPHHRPPAPTTAPDSTQLPGIWGGAFSFKRGADHYFLLPDLQGHTRHLANAAGAVTHTFIYDAWGREIWPIVGTGVYLRPFGQWGYWRDTASRLYVRARHLQVELGRWLSRDPLRDIASVADAPRAQLRSGPTSYAVPKPSLLADPGGWPSLPAPLTTDLLRRIAVAIGVNTRGVNLNREVGRMFQTCWQEATGAPENYANLETPLRQARYRVGRVRPDTIGDTQYMRFLLFCVRCSGHLFTEAKATKRTVTMASYQGQALGFFDALRRRRTDPNCPISLIYGTTDNTAIGEDIVREAAGDRAAVLSQYKAYVAAESTFTPPMRVVVRFNGRILASGAATGQPMTGPCALRLPTGYDASDPDLIELEA